MSVVIGYISERIALIAADTRVVDGKGKIVDDEHTKLVDAAGMGWVAGCGQGQFLDEFKEILGIVKIDSWEKLDKLFKIYSDSTMVEFPTVKAAVENSIVLSIWPNEKGNFYLILNSRNHNNGKHFPLIENRFFVFPHEINNNIDNSDFEFVVEDTDKSFDALLQKTIHLFERAVKSTPNTVSRECDIGILYSTSDGISKRSIKVNIDDIGSNVITSDDFKRFGFSQKAP